MEDVIRRQAAAACVLPLRVAWEPVLSACLLFRGQRRQLAAEFDRLVPRHVFYRKVASIAQIFDFVLAAARLAPVEVRGPLFALGARREVTWVIARYLLELALRYFVNARVECVRNVDLVLGFVRRSPFFFFGRAHREFACRN